MLEVLLTAGDMIRSPRTEYKILGLIGRGGMGAVYRAERSADGSIWALKEMRPLHDLPPAELEENRRLFTQEAELLGKFNHPNLPVVAETFEYQNRPVLVMEFVAGQTLEARIHEANAPLLEQQVIGYGIQLARVLHYLHSQVPPVIYRDMKPSNVMLTPDGVLKLLDFGVARTYKAQKSKDTIAMGSAGYAPPEQYGKGQTDARSDIYALGATLLHLLTNIPPIPLQTPAPGSISQINPSVDRRAEKVIIQAMQLTPGDRFPSMATFEQALMDCLDVPYQDPTLHAAPPPPVVPPTPVPVAAPQPVAQVVPQAAPVASAPVVSVPAVAPQTVPAQAVGPTCGNCGRVNKPRARFCAGCGAPLGVAAPVARLLIRSPRGSWEQKIDRPSLRIGRRDPRQKHYPEIDLAEHDRGVASRNHAIIARQSDYYTLTDLGSTNGTLLNGTRITPNRPLRLRSGDRIKVGEVEMEFRGS